MKTAHSIRKFLGATLAVLLAAGAFAQTPAEPPAPTKPALPALPAKPTAEGSDSNSVATDSAGAPAEDPPSHSVRITIGSNHAPAIFQDYTVEKGHTNMDDAVVVKGDALIDGVVVGDSVVVMGDARINGMITHDLIVVMGSAFLGSNAVVGGDVVVVGGKLNRASGATVGGEVRTFDPEKFPALGGAIPWITHGLLLGRPLPFVGWAWAVAGIFLLINLVLQFLFPQPIKAALDTMEKRPITSFFVGILIKSLTGLLFFLLLVSVVGWIAIPFLSAGLVVAFLCGKIAIYRYAGQQLGRQLGSARLEAPAVALITGTALFYLLYAIPFIGLIAWSFTGLIGMGSVVLACMQQFRREKPSKPMAPPPSAPLATPTAGAAAFGTPAPESFVPPLVSSMAASEAMPEFDITLQPRAGFWIRLGAVLLDMVLFIVPTILIARYFESPLVFFLAWGAYNVTLWTVKGTSVGGIIMGIKLVRLDGRALDFPVCLVRSLASILSFMVLGLGFFWAGFGREKQSWHDKVSGTVMVKVSKNMSLL